MNAAKSAGTLSRWPATWRAWRTASHVRHARAANTNAAKTIENAEALTAIGICPGAMTQSARPANPRKHGSSRAGQDPAGVDRHGDVGPRSRARPDSRIGDGGHQL